MNHTPPPPPPPPPSWGSSKSHHPQDILEEPLPSSTLPTPTPPFKMQPILRAAIPPPPSDSLCHAVRSYVPKPMRSPSYSICTESQDQEARSKQAKMKRKCWALSERRLLMTCFLMLPEQLKRGKNRLLNKSMDGIASEKQITAHLQKEIAQIQDLFSLTHSLLAELKKHGQIYPELYIKFLSKLLPMRAVFSAKLLETYEFSRFTRLWDRICDLIDIFTQHGLAPDAPPRTRQAQLILLLEGFEHDLSQVLDKYFGAQKSKPGGQVITKLLQELEDRKQVELTRLDVKLPQVVMEKIGKLKIRQLGVPKKRSNSPITETEGYLTIPPPPPPLPANSAMSEKTVKRDSFPSRACEAPNSVRFCSPRDLSEGEGSSSCSPSRIASYFNR